MKARLTIYSVLFLLLTMFSCDSSADTSIKNGCPFAPASTNFDTDGSYYRNCPGCFIEFSHREEDYMFKLEELNWWSRSYADVFIVEPFFEFYFSKPTTNSQLFKSLGSRTQILQPDQLIDENFQEIRVAFEIQNYCNERFYPFPEGNIINSFNEISKIELIYYQMYEDFEIEEYAISGRFETFIDVNGLREPIKGRYKLLTKLRKDLSAKHNELR